MWAAGQISGLIISEECSIGGTLVAGRLFWVYSLGPREVGPFRVSVR